MADDQKPKTMDIDDLVRELSKSSTNPVAPTPPLAPASQAPRPSFPTPKPPMPAPFMPKPTVPVTPIPPPVTPPQPKPLEMPKPQFNVPPQPKPAPAPLPTTPLPTPGVREYQSSTRTMNEDISRLKQGLQPTGVPVPRKVEQIVPVPQPQPMPPKSAVPSQQFKVPSVNLGEAQKTGPLAQSKDFSRPGSAAPMPIKPKVESKTQIYVPQEGQKGGNRNMLFIGIGAVAVVAGFSYWFFVLRSPVPEVVIETPTPSVTPTPMPILLSQIFGSPQQITVLTTENFLIGLTNKIEPSNWPAKQFTALSIVDETGNSYPNSKILGIFSASEDLKVNLSQQEWQAVAYGQTEKFDGKGAQALSEKPTGRLVFLAKVANPDLFRTILDPWETFFNQETKKLGKQLKDLGLPDLFASGGELFLDNTYKGVNIRYKNFPYPDKAVDYGIVSMPKYGTEYFFIANSRESAFAIIDFLQSQ